jgi:hypothetical protein
MKPRPLVGLPVQFRIAEKKELARTRQALGFFLVPEERIELSGAQGPADFESAAFTNFTTPAMNVAIYSNYPFLSTKEVVPARRSHAKI